MYTYLICLFIYVSACIITSNFHILKRTVAVLGIIGLTSFGVIPPWKDGGIYCDDPSIRFQFKGDTVPTIWLFIGILVPSLVVVSKYSHSPYCLAVAYRLNCCCLFTLTASSAAPNLALLSSRLIRR